MGKRADNILIIKDLIFVVEFKIGEIHYPQYAKEQIIDYCLDLLNFHEGSHNKKIVPLLVCTKANSVNNDYDNVLDLRECILCNEINFSSKIEDIIQKFSDSQPIDTIKWEESIYKPTPTIIEAAQALYKGHNVKEISRNDSGTINLSRTSEAINKIIEYSKKGK